MEEKIKQYEKLTPTILKRRSRERETSRAGNEMKNKKIF
jgi:hypothetical protein